VAFYTGSIWHGGGANRTDRPRLGVILEYVAAWLRAQENHVIAVDPDVVAGLSQPLQEMLGYNIFPPFMGYVDGRHPRRLLPPRPCTTGTTRHFSRIGPTGSGGRVLRFRGQPSLIHVLN